MRSSIACLRCRRSKIKCVNGGVNTTCRACGASGRECNYPTPASSSGAAAAAASAAAIASNKRDLGVDTEDRNGEWDSPKRPRNRKSQPNSNSNINSPTPRRNNLNNIANANKNTLHSILDSPVLTPKVWESLFDLFHQHFATVLPFIHPSTSLSQIRQLSATSKAEVYPLILLGVLTLTARFHPQLVEHHSPFSTSSLLSSGPAAASEYYANVLRAQLAGADGADITEPNISRIQAFLMLAWYEWGMCRGKDAWIYLGLAVRLSQTMGLPFEDPLEEEFTATTAPTLPPSSLFSARQPSSPSTTITTTTSEFEKKTMHYNADGLIEQEAKRRTVWSCFILDRCLSNGPFRPRALRVRDIAIQLPSDNAFAFGERVRTSRLQARRPRPLKNGPPVPPSNRSDGMDDRIDRWETGAEECVLSRLVRIIRIWWSVSKWAGENGGKSDQYPPWHYESRFNQLRDRLVEFQHSLPRNLQYSTRNTDTHIMYKNTLASYSLMHIIYFLSVMVLHRAYIPYLPLRITEPQGPLDEFSFSHDRFPAPQGFWKDGARELFKSARQMMELIRTCHERGVLMETPLVSFAIYNATFMGVYALHFSHMDEEGYLCSKQKTNDIAGQTDVRTCIEILGSMRPRMKMAVNWFRTVHRYHVIACLAKKETKRSPRMIFSGLDHTLANGQRTSNNNSNELRSHTRKELCDRFKLLDRTLLELGSTEDQTKEMSWPDEDDLVAIRTANAVENNETAAIKPEPREGGDINNSANVDTTINQNNNNGAAGARESWASVNGATGYHHSRITPPTLPPLTTTMGSTALTMAGKESGEKPAENDWMMPLPSPQRRPPSSSSYTLPPFQNNYHHNNTLPKTLSPLNITSTATTTAATTFPPPLSSASSTASVMSTPYFSSAAEPSPTCVSASGTRLPPLQPPPPYSQSLPSLNAAAQQNPALLPFQPNPTHTHSFHAPTPPPHLPPYALSSNPTPPPSRPEIAGCFRAPPSLLPRPHSQHQHHPQNQHTSIPAAFLSHPATAPDGGKANVALITSLDGYDVLAFSEGEDLARWTTATTTSNSTTSSLGRNGGGWLSLLWREYPR